MITILVDASAVDRMLLRLNASLANRTRLHSALAFAVSDLVRTAFADSRDPWGVRWKNLSPVTIARRRKQSAVPLRDTGLLMASIDATSTDRSTSISIGRADRPAHVHQFGNPANRMFGRAPAPIPARPFFPIRNGRVDLQGTEYRDVIAEVVASYVREAT